MKPILKTMWAMLAALGTGYVAGAQTTLDECIVWLTTIIRR